MREDEDKTIEYYDTNAEELAERYENANVDVLHKKLLGTFNTGAMLIEIGCGSGRDAAFMIARGYQVDCVEASRSMVYFALRLHPELHKRIIHGKWENISDENILRSSKYDGVYSIAALMHMHAETIPRVLNRIYSILKPGGRFLFSVPLSRPFLSDSGLDSEGRYYLMLDHMQWHDLVIKAGFKKPEFFKSSDGLGRRDVTWLTCIAQI